MKKYPFQYRPILQHRINIEAAVANGFRTERIYSESA
jgi:hypothetical protein